MNSIPQKKQEPSDDTVPDYMKQTYDWAYINPKNVKFLDREIVVHILLFLNALRLKNYYLHQIQPGDHVWQVAHVYGNLITKAANKVGPDGCFHLSDITPIQVEHAKRKLKAHTNNEVVLSNAASFNLNQQYDLVCSFFLLHEIPDHEKRAVIANMIKKVKPNGKLIFVDYHKPHSWNPIGWILRLVNKYLEPYAFALWEHEIADFGLDTDLFSIQKSTLCAGVYQTVCVTRKAEPQDKS